VCGVLLVADRKTLDSHGRQKVEHVHERQPYEAEDHLGVLGVGLF
jgi:hypothetical protein